MFQDRNITPKHHISTMLPQQIQFGLFPFRSPLLGKSQLISFPRGTKMLQFPRFDLHYHCNGVYRIPIRRSRDHRVRAPTPSLSQLATSFISSQAQQSSYCRLYTGIFSHILCKWLNRCVGLLVKAGSLLAEACSIHHLPINAVFCCRPSSKERISCLGIGFVLRCFQHLA